MRDRRRLGIEMRFVGRQFWRLVALFIATLLALATFLLPRHAPLNPSPDEPVPIPVTTRPRRAAQHLRIHYLFFSATPRYRIVQSGMSGAPAPSNLRSVSSLQAFIREVERIDSGINLNHGDQTSEIMSPLRNALPGWRIEPVFSGSAAVIPGAATSVIVGPRPGDSYHAQVRENLKLSQSPDGKWTIRSRGWVYFNGRRGWGWDSSPTPIVVDRSVGLGGEGWRSGRMLHCIRWLDNAAA